MNNEKHYIFSPAAGLIFSQQSPNWVVDNLIEKGESGINEIALEVGYNNQTSFRRAFKKKYYEVPIYARIIHFADQIEAAVSEKE